MWGMGVPASRPVLRLLARWVSMNERWRPPSLQNGCSALTTPAPWVQREPAPAARVTTATSPFFKAARPFLREAAEMECGLGEVGVVDVLDDGVRRQPVLGEADAAGLEVLADLLVGGAVEAVCGEDFREGFAVAAFSLAAREDGVEQASAPCRGVRGGRGRRWRIGRARRGAAARVRGGLSAKAGGRCSCSSRRASARPRRLAGPPRCRAR